MSIPTDKTIRAVSYNGTNIPLAASEAEYDAILSFTYNWEDESWEMSYISGTVAEIFSDLKAKLADPTRQQAVKVLVLLNEYYFDVLFRRNIVVYPSYAYWEDTEFPRGDDIRFDLTALVYGYHLGVIIKKNGSIDVKRMN